MIFFMNLQRIISSMHRAITDFNLIEDGDKIAIGLSGGKDSLLLTACLGTYRKYSKIKFDLACFTVDAFGSFDGSKLEAFCKQFDVPFTLIPSEIGEVVFNIRKEKNPCSLCAKMRRGALCSTARARGFNKLALAHNADDMVETFIMSMLRENRLSTMQPVSYMSNTEITLIRPIIYCFEDQIKEATKEFEILKNPCPANHKTERENIKNKLKETEKIFPDFKKKLFESLIHPERYNLLKKCKK